MLRFPTEIFETGDPMTKLREFVEKIRTGEFSSWTQFRPTYILMVVGPDEKVVKAELKMFSEEAA